MALYYQEDGITIYHGDCREVLPHLETASLVVTDPPYNAKKNYGDFKDDLTPEEYADFMRAAGVPELVARIADAEQEMAKVREVLHDHSVYFEAELEKRETRIAELEAALRNRICEGCNALVANVGMLHLCGCDEQRNLCSACKAGCACAGGRE